MSEANNVWRVDLGGRQHEIEVEHSTMSGKIVVKVDAAVVATNRMLARKKPISFDVGSHRALVTVDFTYGGFGASSSLHVDDRFVEPLSR